MTRHARTSLLFHVLGPRLASCVVLLCVGFTAGCATANRSRTSASEPALATPSAAWQYQPHSWAKLEAILSWMESEEAQRDPSLQVEAELQLAEGRLEFARAERRISEPAVLRQRLSLAQQGFQSVLAHYAASALQSSRARMGLRSVEEMGEREAAPGPRIVYRSQWGAMNAVRSRLDAASGNWSRITVHHSDESRHGPDSSLASAARGARMVQRYHIEDASRRYGDVGYHFLIGPGGHVLQGRSLEYQGAHAYKQNNVDNIGVCLLGDWQHRPPPEAALRALEQTLNWLRQRYSIPRSAVKGHSDYRVTACPGPYVERWLERYSGRR